MPTRAWARERIKQNELAHVGETVEQARDRFAALVQPDPRLAKQVNYAHELLMRACPEARDLPPEQRPTD
jgi:hypothetical protein